MTPKVKLVIGLIYSKDSFIDQCQVHLEKVFGPIDHISEVFDFNITDYYEPEMGAKLFRKFFSFKTLIEPQSLPEIKGSRTLLRIHIQKMINDV